MGGIGDSCTMGSANSFESTALDQLIEEAFQTWNAFCLALHCIYFIYDIISTTNNINNENLLYLEKEEEEKEEKAAAHHLVQ